MFEVLPIQDAALLSYSILSWLFPWSAWKSSLQPRLGANAGC